MKDFSCNLGQQGLSLLLPFILFFVLTFGVRAQVKQVECGRKLGFTNEDVFSRDPLIGLSWSPGAGRRSLLEAFFSIRKMAGRRKFETIRKGLFVKKIMIPLPCPGDWCWTINRLEKKEILLCGWGVIGGGGLVSLVIDNKGDACISWKVKFNIRIYQLAWCSKRGLLFLLRGDGAILKAKYHPGGRLTNESFTQLKWRGEKPWKWLGGVPHSAIKCESWEGWPYSEKGELVAFRMGGAKVIQKKFFIIRVDGKECYFGGVWENPSCHPLGFPDPFPLIGDKGLYAKGMKGEIVEVSALSPGGGCFKYGGKLGEKGTGWIEIGGGLKMGWVYWLKGAPWRLECNRYAAASPVRTAGSPYSAVPGMRGPEILSPRPVSFHVGKDPLLFQASVGAGENVPLDGLKWFALLAPQEEEGKPPLVYLGENRLILRPMALGRLEPKKGWGRSWLAGIKLPKIPVSAKGGVFWLQFAILKPGMGIVCVSRALGYCVLGAPAYKQDAFTKKYGRNPFLDLLNPLPPTPAEPRWGPKTVYAFREWLQGKKGFKVFINSEAGWEWLKSRYFQKGKKEE